MELTAIDATIGHSFTQKLSEPLLTIGDVTYSRHELVRIVGVANMIAAKRLSDTLRKMKIRSIKQLEQLGPLSLYRVHGTGHTQVYVAMCVLECHGVDVASWWGWDVKGSAVQHRARTEKRKRGAHDTPTPKAVSIR